MQNLTLSALEGTILGAILGGYYVGIFELNGFLKCGMVNMVAVNCPQKVL